jgi:hypothetical protein
MIGKEEDLVIRLKVWLLEGEFLTIKVVLQLVVELSLQGIHASIVRFHINIMIYCCTENVYAHLFLKHDLLSLIYGLMEVKIFQDNELAVLCCLILHNLVARGDPEKKGNLLHLCQSNLKSIPRKTCSANNTKSSINVNKTSREAVHRTHAQSTLCSSSWNAGVLP